jgi:hypothetical protein
VIFLATWGELQAMRQPPTREFVPLGTFWSGDWNAPEDDICVTTTGRDRLELLRQSTYSTSEVLTNKTFYELAEIVLADKGLKPEEYFIDEELKEFSVPYSYFGPQSHREALRKIAEASLGQAYCDREGIIRIEGPSFLETQTEPVATITQDDYFSKRSPTHQIANYVEVETQPLRLADREEIYRSNEPVSIEAGETKTITAYYNYSPCMYGIAGIEGTAGMITNTVFYAWGATITVTSDTAGEFELYITARPLKVLNKFQYIKCEGSTLLVFIIGGAKCQNFNTSNVKVPRKEVWAMLHRFANFNTSNVKVPLVQNRIMILIGDISIHQM